MKKNKKLRQAIFVLLVHAVWISIFTIGFMNITVY